MNSRNVSKTFRTGDRTRTPSGNPTSRVSVAILIAGAGLMLGATTAQAGGPYRGGGGGYHGGGGGGGNSGGGTRVAVSVGVSSGGNFVGGSYSNGFYGNRGFYGGRPYCPPARFCAPAPYCGPRPYWGSGFYGGPRPFCAPVWGAPCATPLFLPPVIVAPNSYVSSGTSIGFGIAGSNGAGFVSYSSAPAVSTFYSNAVYTNPAPIVYSSPAPNVTIINSPPQQVQQPVQVASQQQSVPQYSQPVQQQQPPSTVYQSSGITGTMEKATTPAAIIALIRGASGDARAQTAEFYLGKTPPQAWGVTFEGIQETGGVKEIRCRATEALSNGYKPTIIVRGAGDSNTPPRQLHAMVTGRIALISIDDPAYPGGLIVIDDGWLKW